MLLMVVYHVYLIFCDQVFPLSYLILYLKGAIHQAREEWDGAKSCYQNALSIYPRHLQSLQVNTGLSLDNTDHVTKYWPLIGLFTEPRPGAPRAWEPETS